jgi:hypothetical protein
MPRYAKPGVARRVVLEKAYRVRMKVGSDGKRIKCVGGSFIGVVGPQQMSFEMWTVRDVESMGI